MKRRITRPQTGYAILISLILLVLSTGVIIFEFQYQKQQSIINRELIQKLRYQIKENIDRTNDRTKENVHNYRGESGEFSTND